MTEIFNIALLIDNLKHEEVNERLRSMQSLDKIATALGTRRTAQELLPFLCDCVDDDDDVLLQLLQQLKRFPSLAGSEQPLIPVLQLLAVGDSKVVRDQAVESILELKESSIILPVVEQLLDSEWYNYRTSGLALLRRYLQSVQAPEKRANALKQVRTCSTDPLPMVRRAVAESLAEFVKELNLQEMQTLIKPLLKLLSEDSQDAVRAVAIRAIAPVLLQFSKLAKENQAQLNDINVSRKEIYQRFIIKQCSEESWRTRYICADVFSSIIEAYLGFSEFSPLYTLPKETQDARECDEDVDPFKGNSLNQITPSVVPDFNKQIVKNSPELPVGPDFDEVKAAQTFAKLLADKEPETRCVAIQRVIRVSNRLQQSSIQSHILPQLEERAISDDSIFVRVTLARHISYIAPLLSKDIILKQLVSVILKQLDDKDANVRVFVLKNLLPVTQVVGLSVFGDKIQNTIVVLSEEADWRVRVQVIESLVEISKLIESSIFDQKFKNLAINYLNDPVNYVRRIAASSLVQIALAFGIEWARKVVVGQISDMSKKQNYLQRNNCLFLAEELALVLGKDLGQDLQSIFIQLCEDQVPNIRFMACEVIGKISKSVPESVKTQLLQKVNSLLNDADKDVQQFAQAALKAAK
ncbi:Serine/threonine-protein phosphatase 2A [Spironucleus salmonicida]|uniref:Serine/threonine-protein phosphatase 2A n=1 Tax=Spironucleus salmonicida TaxID=348837 RepID=V6LX20_9EUKA|nr:Serine/threonine-protein phosphatase 2A [Spironucleus salmonicida]|eukprot:EST49157.1 Serine/threonine-protein phosphatase 2A [Spironucleus salmonicida]